MQRLYYLLFLFLLSPAKADIIIYEHADCAPEFTLFPPNQEQLASIANKQLKGLLWKFKSKERGCLWDPATGKKTPGSMKIFAISKPQPLSAHLCVFKSFSSTVDIKSRRPRLFDKEHRWAIASSPCPDVTADYFVDVPREITIVELPKLGEVLETLLSRLKEGD
ncbi:MAG TPA: hypothetical protein VHL14_06790, partial [Steroidobacteraceae bacterium]|nr:hypothetical protein [Steroidobacteraceae bacterium]